MKIPDALILAHFNTFPERIEYTVKDRTTRVYFKFRLNKDGAAKEVILEFTPSFARASLVGETDGKEFRLVLARAYSKGEDSQLAMVLDIKEQLRRVAEAFTELYIDTEDMPDVVTEPKRKKLLQSLDSEDTDLTDADLEFE